MGVAAAGAATRMSRIARAYAAAEHPAMGTEGHPVGSGAAPLWFDGRLVTPAGAAFAGAATLDSLDGHDGHALTKGHAGAAVLPAALALLPSRSDSREHPAEPAETARREQPRKPAEPAQAAGRELLTALVVGYEIATRAGITLHAQAADYHSSGSWNAVGCAAVAARILRLDASPTAHALGIAEYHGPRGPMMHCIAQPTMLKDNSAWGAHSGVSAALLAAHGYTGAPAHLMDDSAEVWRDLGSRWRILEQYFKPYPVCRWAHPAVHAVLTVRRQAGVPAGDIDHVRVRTFDAARSLCTRRPADTEQAQYSLPFPVAAAAVHGDVPLQELAEPLSAVDPHTLRLSDSMRVTTVPEYERAFPARRFADVTLVLRDGTELTSGPTEAPGSPEHPLDDAALSAKFHALATPALGDARTAALETAVTEGSPDLRALVTALTAPVAAVPRTGPG